jgi:predicted heme/steroid binding protein
MYKLRIPLIVFFILLLTYQVYSAQTPLSSWITLRSDVENVVKDLIRSEVDKREGFSTSQEERANLRAVEDEKDAEDNAFKKRIATANKEFNQAKKRRDDVTAQFQAVSIELEEQQKNINTTKAGIENLDNQITRYNQDIKTQQDSLKKWLQTEKQGEALVAAIFTRGFRDSAHALESAADKESAPLMAQYMGTSIQSYSKVIDSVLSVDFIRAVEEGTAKWNNEDPLRIELEKGNKGSTYLRMKRYELFPFQAPKTGQIKPGAGSKKIQTAIINSRKELNKFLTNNGYPPANYDLDRVDKLIRETAQMNTAADEGLREQVKSFQDRIVSLQEKISAARQEKELQSSLLKKKGDPYRKAAQERDALQSKKEEVDRLFQASQKALHDIRRVRETIIIKTALATARGSQSFADASAEAIIDKLAEVKNDAKMQHSTSTTEVTNFQVTAESSLQAITEARITSARLISFINEGDSVRVKMAFRIRTVLEESAEASPAQPPQFPQKVVAEPPQKAPKDKSLFSYIPSVLKPQPDKDRPAEEQPHPQPEPAAPAKTPVKRNPNALGTAEAKDVLFELVSIKYSGGGLSVFVDITNMTENDYRDIALYDDTYGWTKSKMKDASGNEYDVSQVVFWKGQQKQTMYEAGRRGASMEGGTKQTAQLIFKKAPTNLKSINKLTLHPFVYFRRVFSWSWQENNFVFQNIHVGR